MSNVVTPKTPTKAGMEEGGSAAIIATILRYTMTAVRAKNPNLPWAPDLDIAAVGILTGVLAGVWKGFRKSKTQ